MSESSAASAASPSTPLPIARAVLIDMEPKVIHTALNAANRCGRYRYDPKSTFWKQSGSGNNWAHGFTLHGPSSRDRMVDLVRRELEYCASVSGLLVLQSVAGGTGSGVGAYLTEVLRDELPEVPLLNQIVWPYQSGEVSVQNYNALLTLGHLHEHSDGLLLFENDILHSICSRRLQLNTPTFQQMNAVLANAITQIMLPASITQAAPFYNNEGETSNSGAGGGSTSDKRLAAGNRNRVHDKRSHSRLHFLPPTDRTLLRSCSSLDLFSDAVSHLFSHPSYRLSTLRSLPQISERAKEFESSSWHALMKAMTQMSITGGQLEEKLDWSVASIGKAVAASSSSMLQKRQWHQHWSSSARACLLYDTSATFDASIVQPTASFIPHAAGASSSSSSSRPVGIFDNAPPAAGWLNAFIDGESLLEYKMNEERHAMVGNANRRKKSSLQQKQQQQQRTTSTTGSTPSPSSPFASSSPIDSDPYTTSISQLLFLRGSSVCSADASTLLDPSLYASWSMSPLMVARDRRPVQGHQRAAALWSNGSSVVRPLDAMLDKVYGMLHEKAYVHHYMKYGLELDSFWQQVASLEQISQDYKSITHTTGTMP